jgi:predicted PurR-regulated permease PerM
MPSFDPLQRYVYVLLAVCLSVVVLYFGRDLIILALISALFAFLMLPLCRRIERWGAPRWAAAMAATLLLLVVVLGSFFFLGWQLSSFGKDIPALQAKFTEKGLGVLAWIEQQTAIGQREQVQWFNAHLNDLAEYGGKTLLQVFSTTGAALAFVVPIPIFVFLLLLLKDKFRTFFTQVGAASNGLVLEVMVRISGLSRKYIRGVLIVLVILGVLNSIGFLILGLKYAVLLGFLAGFLNIIPYIGVLIGSLFPIIIALITKDSLAYAVGALGVCVFTQFLENNFITPKVVGSSVSINPHRHAEGGVRCGARPAALRLPVGRGHRVSGITAHQHPVHGAQKRRPARLRRMIRRKCEPAQSRKIAVCGTPSVPTCPRYMPVQLKSSTTVPFLSTAIIPPSPSRGGSFSCTTTRTASWSDRPL